MLADYLAKELGNIPHQSRAASAWQAVRDGVPGADARLTAGSLFAQDTRRRGEIQSEDFELHTQGHVDNETLKKMVIAYYAEQGWEHDADDRFDLVNMFTLRNGAGTLLDVIITNWSDLPALLPGEIDPVLRPKIEITCTIVPENLRIP